MIDALNRYVIIAIEQSNQMYKPELKITAMIVVYNYSLRTIKN